MTSTFALDESLSGFEFDVPCDSPGCSESVAAMLSKSHSTEGCWGPTVGLCKSHVERILASYAEWLSGPASRCSGCLKPIEGVLEQNVRVMWL